MDSGEIDFAILHALKIFVNSSKNEKLTIIGTNSLRIMHQNEQKLMKYPIMQALLQEKILYSEKHSAYIKFEQDIFLKLAQDYIEKTKPFYKRSKDAGKVRIIFCY